MTQQDLDDLQTLRRMLTMDEHAFCHPQADLVRTATQAWRSTWIYPPLDRLIARAETAIAARRARDKRRTR